MSVIPGEVIIDTAPRQPQPQPIQALADLGQKIDDNVMRQAVATAEANNQNPLTLSVDDVLKAQSAIGAPPAPAAAPAPVQVPEKFLKSDGTVDVEKIQASTKQLDEAIQRKEDAVNRTVDDYMREYQERESKFRNLPNPERLAANVNAALPPVPAAPTPAPTPNLSQPQLEDIVRRDYNQDPLMTTARLIDLALEARFKPLQEREKMDAVRSNIQGLAEKDARVLRPDVFEAIKAKLSSDPELWRLKNPHKAAWLEVKEELRLGDPIPGQAQPSRPSPVLGGGVPPSAPSASVPTNPNDVIANLHRLDLRDKKQEELGDAAVRAALMGNRG